jgi:glycosyltransferase involved in cell wall biosynthesis
VASAACVYQAISESEKLKGEIGNMNPPTVSVIIPSYNAADLVVKAIKSVLTQDFAGIEVLVVDDGSTDGTAQLVGETFSDPRVRLLQHPDGKNHGVCASRRLALTIASGEYVAFLDADDYYLPDKFTRHVAILEKHPEAVLVHGTIVFSSIPGAEDQGPFTFPMPDGIFEYDCLGFGNFLLGCHICNSTVVCRRRALHFTDLPHSLAFQIEDWLLWTYIAGRGTFIYDKIPLTVYNANPQGYTYTQLKHPGRNHLAHLEYLTALLAKPPQGVSRKKICDALTVAFENLLDVKKQHWKDIEESDPSAPPARAWLWPLGCSIHFRLLKHWFRVGTAPARRAIRKIIPKKTI